MAHIERCSTGSLPQWVAQWVALRIALWPDENAAIMTEEAPALLAHPDRLVLLARGGDTVTGFAEAAIRHDHVNGCETRPVVFLEGIYVVPAYRRQGVARQLIARVED